MEIGKDFQITAGKGFRFPLPGGWTLSVQFGTGNYCENNRPHFGVEWYGDWSKMDLEAGERGSDTVEIAVWDGNGNWRNVLTLERAILPNGERDTAGEVRGWCTAPEVWEVAINVRDRLLGKLAS